MKEKDEAAYKRGISLIHISQEDWEKRNNLMKTINSYICEYCGKSFTNEKDCIEHEKSHSFEKEISDLAYDSFSYIMKLTELSDKYGVSRYEKDTC